MAARFWVGGTGTWDNSSTTHWATSSGGSSGASVPGVNDTVTFDSLSGGGTVTVNTPVNIVSLATGSFTGTLDFSVNNNDITLSGTANAFNGSGTGTRTIKLGNGTWTLSGGGSFTLWTIATTTGLTFNAGSSTIVFSDTSTAGVRAFLAGSGLTYNNITIADRTSFGLFSFSTTSHTLGALKIGGKVGLVLPNGGTVTASDISTTASVGSMASLESNGNATSASTGISIASGTRTLNGIAIQNVTFSGGATFLAKSSLDLGGNTGITITSPGGTSRARIQGAF